MKQPALMPLIDPNLDRPEFDFSYQGRFLRGQRVTCTWFRQTCTGLVVKDFHDETRIGCGRRVVLEMGGHRELRYVDCCYLVEI